MRQNETNNDLVIAFGIDLFSFWLRRSGDESQNEFFNRFVSIRMGGVMFAPPATPHPGVRLCSVNDLPEKPLVTVSIHHFCPSRCSIVAFGRSVNLSSSVCVPDVIPTDDDEMDGSQVVCPQHWHCHQSLIESYFNTRSASHRNVKLS